MQNKIKINEIEAIEDEINDIECEIASLEEGLFIAENGADFGFGYISRDAERACWIYEKISALKCKIYDLEYKKKEIENA